MKNLSGTILLLITCLCVFASYGRSVETWNFGWKFCPGNPAGAESPMTDDRDWQTVDLPHDFQISQPWVEPAPEERPDLTNQVANVKSRLSSRGFKEMGTGWYRKSFIADSSWIGKRIILDFEGIMLTGDIYLNGERVGGTDYGYLGTEVDLSPLLKYGSENLIAVKADTGKPENSRWYTGGGLFRDVNLIFTDKKHYFTRNPLRITTPVADPDSSTVCIGAEIASYHRPDSLTVGVRITDPDGGCVYEATKRLRNYRGQRIREFQIDSITIADARLWDTENPNLYTLNLSLINSDGTVADTHTEKFGIRSIEFTPESGFKLNGRKVLLKGIANHHTLGALGAAAYPRAIEKRIAMLKEFGVNHIRTSHNPYSKAFLDLCDRYGILVVDELYDKWKRQYSGDRKDWTEQWQHDVEEWARRDRNHPSVILWSLGNELQTISDLPFNDWGVTPYRLQKALLDRYDGTRLSTVAMHPRGRNHFTDSLPAPLALATDIASYNYRYMYFPGDSRRYPDMIFYQSEANTSGMGPNYFDMDLDRVVGLAYWGMIDYLGESQGWPAKGWSQGMFDISLEPKPLAYFLKSYLKPEEPLVRIAIAEGSQDIEWNGVQVGTTDFSSHWNHPVGSTLQIFTFTNADEVELLVNGRSLGRKTNETSDSKTRNRIYWDNVPYSKGEIEARAYKKGDKTPIATHQLRTAGAAARLLAQPDNGSWKSDGMDLQHVRISAVDSRSTQVPDEKTTLKFAVEGPAEIVGVINGDITSDELSTGHTRRLYNGTASVILRSTRSPGEVILTVTPQGGSRMKPAVMKLKTEL
ncbi:MAG: DUF4982 domain-containing protein [Staphylococcus sp.]|nr:DUF4982 domain-containing protein [Staphylococcus sp.]